MQHSAYRMRFEFAVFLGDQNYRKMTRRSYVPYKGPLIHCVVESVVDRSILFLLYGGGESKMFKCFQSAGATATMFILPFFLSFDILESSCAYKPLGRSVCTLYKSATTTLFQTWLASLALAKFNLRALFSRSTNGQCWCNLLAKDGTGLHTHTHTRVCNRADKPINSTNVGHT